MSKHKPSEFLNKEIEVRFLDRFTKNPDWERGGSKLYYASVERWGVVKTIHFATKKLRVSFERDGKKDYSVISHSEVLEMRELQDE